MENCIEVWDLRMFKRTQIIDWAGTGSDILVAQEAEGELDNMTESATEREVSEQTENEEQEESKVPRDSQSESTVVATSRRTKAKRPPRRFAPQLYTTCFNKTEDLLFCGGAGKNEMRVFDW